MMLRRRNNGKKEVVVVPAEWGKRDAGKHFLINEVVAGDGEKWAWRLAIAVKGTSAQIDPEIAKLGMVGVAMRGLNSMLAADVRFDDLEPLLDEMMTCIDIVRDPQNHPEVGTPLGPEDIEEIVTRAWLRSEVLSLHTGFGVTAALSMMWDWIQYPTVQETSLST